MPAPTVAQFVHYIGHTVPDCRAAIVTAVDEFRADRVDLCVLNPMGISFVRSVLFSAGAATPGLPDCPQQTAHGNPFRYCECGWREPGHKPNTWHWLEKVS